MDSSSCSLERTLAMFLIICMFIVVVIVEQSESTAKFTAEKKRELRSKALEMFYHAYNSYMNHAYPADELMPLSCKGRYRGSEPDRGDVDDTLGNFTLTLIDTLDTLAVLGDLEEFEKAVRNVIADSRFDADVIVSVFETNIRILGGLLGGHVAASYFKRRKVSMQWYQDELLTMAKEVGDRLLPAFNTTTGIPYPRINLKHGITPSISSSHRDTCTSCAGTMILEFAALSRLTGISVYEEKARKAMDYLWAQRHRSNNLMGMVINIHNGDWVRRESGVGAGIDSYYEYVLKAYVLLGDDTYLSRFNKHYDAVMRYISQGPLLVDVHMHKPTSVAKNFMDSLLAFWPGLQVLAGDIGPAVETHEMLYQIVQRHNFLPEAFTTDFRVHWGQHPLRPEFLESTYFLYEATGDPYYLSVGQTVLENLEQHARVECGFAAIKDLKTGSHENHMDSFVLAETFKYLYLLFSEKEDIIMDLNDFIFTTEAHLLPLTLSVGNYSWKVPTKVGPDIYKFERMSVAEMAMAAEEESRQNSESEDYDEDRGVCRNYQVTDTEGPGYPHKLRHQMKDMVNRMHPRIRSEPQKLKAADFVAGNKEHLDILRDMGIRIATMPDGRIQLLHTSSEAVSPAHAEAGLHFMQEMIELSKLQKQESQHEPMFVRLLSEPFNGETWYKAGPAQFGYDLSKNSPVQGQLTIARPFKGCSDIENDHEIAGKIAVVERGECMFVEKARNLQKRGAVGGIVLDQAPGSSSEVLSLFAMSGDGSNDVTIPMVFLFWRQGQDLLEAWNKNPDLLVELTGKGNVQSASQVSDVQTPTVSSPSEHTTQPPLSGPPSATGSSSSQSISTVQYSPPQEQQRPPTPSMIVPSESSSASDSSSSRSEHGFYHHEFLDTSTGQYFLQAGTKAVHFNIEVSAREESDSEEDCRHMKHELIPDGSQMFTFHLRYKLLTADKPNLNQMYLDVIHSLEHNSNLGQLTHSSEYKKAIAKFMESAFFSLDRIDQETFELMLHFTQNIRVKHIFPQGEAVFVGKSEHIEPLPNVPVPLPVVSQASNTRSTHPTSTDSQDAIKDKQTLEPHISVVPSSQEEFEVFHEHRTNQQSQDPNLQYSSNHLSDSSSLERSSSDSLTSTEYLGVDPLPPETQSSLTEKEILDKIKQKFEDSMSEDLKHAYSESKQQPSVEQQASTSSSTSARPRGEEEGSIHRTKDEF